MMKSSMLFEPYLDWIGDADSIDHKIVEGPVGLKDFVAALLSYRPAMVRWAYVLRRWQLKVAGFEVDCEHADDQLTAETLSLEPGTKATFFDVLGSDGQTQWVAECPESHLLASLAVRAESTGKPGINRFHVGTAVKYLGWRGGVEYNCIRPFHHLFLWAAMRHSAVPAVGRS